MLFVFEHSFRMSEKRKRELRMIFRHSSGLEKVVEKKENNFLVYKMTYPYSETPMVKSNKSFNNPKLNFMFGRSVVFNEHVKVMIFPPKYLNFVASAVYAVHHRPVPPSPPQHRPELPHHHHQQQHQRRRQRRVTH